MVRVAALADELVTILEIVVPRKRLSDVVARIERRAVQSFNKTDPVLIDDSCFEEPHVEQARLRFAGTFDRSGLHQDAIDARCQDVDLWSFLPAGSNELFGVLEITMVGDRLTKQAPRIKWTTVRCSDYTNFALRYQCSLGH